MREMPVDPMSASRSSHKWIRWFYDLYRDGLRSQSRMSRLLWIIVAIKLFVMFAILRPIFFPRVIALQGDKPAQIEYVQEQLTAPIVNTPHNNR